MILKNKATRKTLNDNFERYPYVSFKNNFGTFLLITPHEKLWLGLGLGLGLLGLLWLGLWSGLGLLGLLGLTLSLIALIALTQALTLAIIFRRG